MYTYIWLVSTLEYLLHGCKLVVVCSNSHHGGGDYGAARDVDWNSLKKKPIQKIHSINLSKFSRATQGSPD